MKVITTREIKVHTKTFFELAEKERVAVKRGKNKYVNLIVSEDPDELSALTHPEQEPESRN